MIGAADAEARAHHHIELLIALSLAVCVVRRVGTTIPGTTAKHTHSARKSTAAHSGHIRSATYTLKVLSSEPYD